MLCRDLIEEPFERLFNAQDFDPFLRKDMMKRKSLFDIQLETIKVVKNINILEKISWPSQLEAHFFSELAKGNRPILNVQYKKTDLNEEKKALKNLRSQLGSFDPTHVYTKETIESYLNAIEMIHSVGSSRFQELSIKEYGTPSHKLFGSKYSHLKTAEEILKVARQFDHPSLQDPQSSLSAQELKKYLIKESKKILIHDAPKIVLSKKLVAKAAAGKTRVRLRSHASFSRYDFDQLLVHEIMTHSLTAINGSYQMQMPLMAQGAPRTSKTQEGLATFSEIMTGSMDLLRLKRLALRLIAIDMALAGADFYDLFRFFVDNEQDPKESYLSASRIFRGGSAHGGVVFTKDGIYLEGLIRVHSFFRWAFKHKHLDLTHYLFSGRLDINDIFNLREDFERGVIAPPKYLPDWYRNIDQFAGKMAFSLVLNGIDLENVERHYSSKLLKIAA